MIVAKQFGELWIFYRAWSTNLVAIHVNRSTRLRISHEVLTIILRAWGNPKGSSLSRLGLKKVDLSLVPYSSASIFFTLIKTSQKGVEEKLPPRDVVVTDEAWPMLAGIIQDLAIRAPQSEL